jgi:hypothetical protein
MDLLVQLIVGLAWPLVVFGIVVVLRKDLTNLIGRVSKVRYKELEAEFHETLKQIAEKPEQSRAQTRESGEFDAWNPPLTARKKELHELAHMSPRAAILEAWIDLESQIRRSANYLDLVSTGDSLSVFEAVAEKSKRFTPSYLKHVRELRKLRNLAAHEQQLSLPEGEAMHYVTVALELAASIDAFTNPEHSHHLRDIGG